KNTLSSSYMTVLNHYASSFFTSNEFTKLNKSVNESLSQLQAELLDTMSTKLSKLVNEQFEEDIETYVNFKEFKPTHYLQNSELRIKENNIDTNLFDNGNGMQRAVTISLIKEMASINNLNMAPSVFLIDEPEVFLHPMGQKSLARELVKLSIDQQVFIATHSPYIIDSYTKDEDDINSMTVLHKLTTGETIIKDISDEMTNITNRPTTAEISYFAYNIPTLEFHDQLFSKAQDNTKTHTIQAVDQKFLEYIRNNSNVESLHSFYTETKHDTTKYYTLPTKIRNLAHHDYNSDCLKDIVDGELLRNSIEFLLIFNKNF
ncbi:ATP-dependent endonuclease, partial (plasmid) [Weissella cibaria]